ncbi:hypothetical protein ADK67_18555 [Saccharothrix sp. NRRL B-16348]|uniref:hypothetical protein n=1 Tax=Saccharothrix sp. NRRL B-16348 TaxID=1415542 RepID=UPI0006AEE6A6|nr:hypothetical protein [Saccharothrix sp. NRRL B-16348]KOX24562.1 hypothetical protein ADK67_18555 [Saccharothrix sp. NRRL B-16348]
MTRDPAAARLPAGVEVVAGDFTGPSSLAAAVKALVEEGTPVGPTSRPVRHRCFGGTRCG